MKVELVRCGPFANESEQMAANALKTRLISTLGSGEWLLLTNLAFSAGHHRQSDEVDIVVIGPPGVQVIEVKHWSAAWTKKNRDLVEHEADRVTQKARKIGTTLRREIGNLPRVDGVFLVTQEPSKVKQIEGTEIRGVRFYTLRTWQGAVGIETPPSLSPSQVQKAANILYPNTRAVVDGQLRRLGGYVNLSLQTPPEERFHRLYKGVHSTRRTPVLLHLYDLSASDKPSAEVIARREFDALHRLQLHAWAPRVEDSFQEAMGYAGEMWFFTVGDPVAPTLSQRAQDAMWAAEARTAFAKDAVRALADLHETKIDGQPFLHRNISPDTVLVKHDNTAILTGFQRARIPADETVTVSGSTAEASDAVAPEVRVRGIGVADRRSDVYALCASLSALFAGFDDAASKEAADVLLSGMADDPAARESLDQLHGSLSGLLGESTGIVPAPPSRFWTEDQEVSFRGRNYRIVSRLGSGGVGTTFKVVAIDRATGRDLGAYVAKVVHDKETGERVLSAYELGRSHLHHSALSIIFETADHWSDNSFLALLKWVDGEPLSELAGVLPIYAEDLGEESGEALALRWLWTLCEALDVLHRNGLVHGDVSPRNMIVSGEDIVLTDYDCVTKIGRRQQGLGTVIYSSDTVAEGRLVSPADDIYALAASFFHVLFERHPFSHDGDFAQERGLNWAGVVGREQFPRVAAFLDRATEPDPGSRFSSVAEAKVVLSHGQSNAAGKADGFVGTKPDTQPSDHPTRRENEIPWLRSLLQSYPGSPWGNSETRGLDSEFAVDTYVETELEGSLREQIEERRARLVILCGNAGDGKTALLQHLAQRLGLGNFGSETRIVDGRTESGLRVRMNLDGSASWRQKSADDLLDELLGPYQQGEPPDGIVHLLAINDGRLLEWIERVEERNGGQTPLTRELSRLLDGDQRGDAPEYISFVSLNERSLVGGVTGNGSITTDFLDRLVDSLYGGERATDMWAPCLSCSAEARCEVRRAMRLFGPAGIGGGLDELDRRPRGRQRLFEALQAVHLRGETHITMRELRASLVYVLFGVHYCSDYHRAAEEAASQPDPYWDRAFAANSQARQGDVLRELVRFDPALEAHPKLDRHLLGLKAQGGEPPDLRSARRKAYFEMTESELEAIAAERDCLGLARGQHMRDFRDLALAEQPDAELCRRLCAGISRLEDLPPQALDRRGVVSLRITPRTPTETAFWVEKDLASFRLDVGLHGIADGLDRLHREATLVYVYRDGGDERLRLGADLFHVLLELGDGYQLGDVSTDDTFAQLAIFIQRLVQEDERRLLAWNPMQANTIYEVIADVVNVATLNALQQIQLKPLEQTDG